MCSLNHSQSLGGAEVHRYERFLRVSYGAKPLMTQDIRWLRKSPTVPATWHWIGIWHCRPGAVVGSGGRGECGYDGYRQLQFICGGA